MGMQQRDVRRALTLKVRHALELIGHEDDATATVLALGTRGLVVIEREKLMSEAWLTERISLLHQASEIRNWETEVHGLVVR